jgi:putative membrane protein
LTVDGNWRPEVALPLGLAIVGYTIGWARLALRSPVSRRPAALRGLALALAGLVVLAIALLGLHGPAHERFLHHMIQHVLLMMIAVPLILLADPLPAVLWALPSVARRRARMVLGHEATARRAWEALTRLAPAWTLYALVLWTWHLPAAYDAALASGWLHDVEHVTFLLAAVVFWWPVIAPAPRPRRAPPATALLVYLLLAAFSGSALGVLLAASPTSLYAYGGLPGGPNPVEDQAAGGLVMWAVGGAVDVAAILAVVARVLAGGRRPREASGSLTPLGP